MRYINIFRGGEICFSFKSGKDFCACNISPDVSQHFSHSLKEAVDADEMVWCIL